MGTRSSHPHPAATPARSSTARKVRTTRSVRSSPRSSPAAQGRSARTAAGSTKARSRKKAGGTRSVIAAGEDIERRLAAAALTKRREGRIPTQRETRALRRIEARQEEELRWRYYATIPLKHWEAMSGGLGRKVIRDQATRYAIPFSGPVIDLTAVVAALHRFLADHAVLLSAAAGRGKAFGETTHAAETRLKIAKADLLELELHKTRGELIDQSEAARRRSAIVQWVLDLFGRAPAELAAALAGKKPRQVRRVIEDYFDRVRRDVAAGGS